MWRGHIVPIIDGRILLPASIRSALGLVQGTRLIASAYPLASETSGTDPLTNEDLIGGILFSITRKRVLERLVRFHFLLDNQIGALRDVTEVIADNDGQIIQLEGIASGHVSCQVLFPTLKALKKCLRAFVDRAEDESDALRRFSVTSPLLPDEAANEAQKAIKKTLGSSERAHLVDELGDLRRILDRAQRLEKQAREGPIPTSHVPVRAVRVEDDAIPFPNALFQLLCAVPPVDGEWMREPLAPPSHVVLATSPGHAALTCLIPRRPLIEIGVRSATHEGRDAKPGVGLIHTIARVLGEFKIGIVHMQIDNHECRYAESEPLDAEPWPGQKRLLTPSYEDGRIRLIASIPPNWVDLSPAVLDRELETLQRRIQSATVPSPPESPTLLSERLVRLHDACEAFSQQGDDELRTNIGQLKDSIETAKRVLAQEERPSPEEARKNKANLLRALLNVKVALDVANKLPQAEGRPAPGDLRALLASFEPEAWNELLKLALTDRTMPLQEVDIHGPPLLRCFFAHSDQPEEDELKLIAQIRTMLEGLSFHVQEGQWTYGRSIDDSTRKLIRRSVVLVSLLWPRTVRRENPVATEQLASEWVVHEESFAMGAEIGIFRFREINVREPHYRRDFREYLVNRDDPNTWDRAVRECRAQLKRYILARLLARDE